MTTKELSEGSLMTKDEKMGMFTVKSQYSKGSVEVARGSRMSIFPRSQVRKKRYTRVSKIATEARRRASISKQTVLAIEKKANEKGRPSQRGLYEV